MQLRLPQGALGSGGDLELDQATEAAVNDALDALAEGRFEYVGLEELPHLLRTDATKGGSPVR